MKIKVTIVACLVVIAALFGVAYHEYQNKQHVKAVRAANVTQLQGQLQQARNANDEMVKKYNSLFEECQKGVSAYGLLTPAQKTTGKAVMPNCGLAIIQ